MLLAIANCQFNATRPFAVVLDPRKTLRSSMGSRNLALWYMHVVIAICYSKARPFLVLVDLRRTRGSTMDSHNLALCRIILLQCLLQLPTANWHWKGRPFPVLVYPRKTPRSSMGSGNIALCGTIVLLLCCKVTVWCIKARQQGHLTCVCGNCQLPKASRPFPVLDPRKTPPNSLGSHNVAFCCSIVLQLWCNVMVWCIKAFMHVADFVERPGLVYHCG